MVRAWLLGPLKTHSVLALHANIESMLESPCFLTRAASSPFSGSDHSVRPNNILIFLEPHPEPVAMSPNNVPTHLPWTTHHQCPPVPIPTSTLFHPLKPQRYTHLSSTAITLILNILLLLNIITPLLLFHQHPHLLAASVAFPTTISYRVETKRIGCSFLFSSIELP